MVAASEQQLRSTAAISQPQLPPIASREVSVSIFWNEQAAKISEMSRKIRLSKIMWSMSSIQSMSEFT